jgi:hypothetical protein
MKGKLFEASQLLKVDIGREIDAVFIDRAGFQSSIWIAEHFADIGDGKFDALLLKRIRQKTQCTFFDCAFARIRIRRLQVIGFFVFLRQRKAAKGEPQTKGQEGLACNRTGWKCQTVAGLGQGLNVGFELFPALSLIGL